MESPEPETAESTDWTLFSATVAIILVACVPIIGLREAAAIYITGAYDLITSSFGVAYLWYGFGLVLFLLWLAASRYGKVTLGAPGTCREFSTPSWVAMIFTTGVGAGLMYWAVVEWAYYIGAPPYGLEPRSDAAIEWAASYGIFHWGFTGWAIFCLPALAIAYPYHGRYNLRLRVLYARLGIHLAPEIR